MSTNSETLTTTTTTTESQPTASSDPPIVDGGEKAKDKCDDLKLQVEGWSGNADQVLKKFKEAIPNAVFVAVDCEFSGLRSNKIQGMPRRITRHDSPQDRYGRVRHSASDFALLQLGLSVFTYQETKGSFLCTTFTLNLFPQTTMKGYDKRFLCQASSMKFLAAHNFNFNKLFTEGIAYLSKEDKQSFREGHDKHRDKKEARKLQREKGNVRVTPESAADREFVEDMKVKLNELVRMHKIDTTRKVTIKTSNGFQRLLVYNNIRHEFPTLTHAKIPHGSGADVEVSWLPTKLSREDVDKQYREKRELDLAKALDAQCGLEKFIDALADAKIPWVTHNGFLDLLHIYKASIGALPEELDEFILKFRKIADRVIDTKFMANVLGRTDEQIGRTALGELFERSEEWAGPRVELFLPKIEQAHDAGYDAQMTGMVLLKLLVKAGVLTNRMTNFSNKFLLEHSKMKPYLDVLPLPISITKLTLNPDLKDSWKNDFKHVVLCEMSEYVPTSELEKNNRSPFREHAYERTRNPLSRYTGCARVHN